MKSNLTCEEAVRGKPENDLQELLTFNIIYIPGMTKYLEPFVSSLLNSTSCRYRLVANGCFRDEERLLESYCREESRLEFFLLSSDEILTHCQALSLLQEMESSDHFCFMDADIFSRGRFLEALLPCLDHHMAVFSAYPIWCDSRHQVITEDWPEMGGRHIRTSAGLCLGSSYFAIYDNRVLNEFITSTGITLRRYRWHEVPPRYQDSLMALGLKKNFYDTGKVLNILLQAQGHKLSFVESTSLVHLGAMTEFFAGRVNRLVSGKLPHFLSLRYRDFRILTSAFKRRFKKVMRIESPAKSEYEDPSYRQMLEVRATVSTYFLALLLALSNNRSFNKTLHIESPNVKRNVELAAEGIKAIWKENSFRTKRW